MSAEENIKLKEYKELIEIIAKVEYQKFSNSHLIELPELINIGTHALYILFKNKEPEKYNNTYLSTAIKWAIRNEVRRRYKWYTLKNKQVSIDEDAETNDAEMRADVYKNILESMKKLPPRERELIEYKFFKEKKLREIAEEFNISQSRISRIIQTGLDRIKKDLAKQGII